MLFVKASVRKSAIAGLGLFIEQDLERGEAAVIFSHGLQIIPEKNYLECTLAGDDLIIRTGCRWLNGSFIYRESGIEDEDFVNHSQDPNMLYHCGICFARRDIKSGEELTLDYKYLLSADEPGFYDSLTGVYVKGVSGRECLVQSARELVEILARKEPVLLRPARNKHFKRTAFRETPVERPNRLKALYMDAMIEKGMLPEVIAGGVREAVNDDTAAPRRLMLAKKGVKDAPALGAREVELTINDMATVKGVKAGIRFRRTR